MNDELDENNPLWCLNEQIKGLLEGEGASEDHAAVIAFLQATGLPEGTARRVHRAIVCGDSKVIPDYPAIVDVLAERARQTAKWGEQNHDLCTWSAILSEENGEFAQSCLHQKFGGPAAKDLRNEAVQVAAVAVQIVEYIDRHKIGSVVPCAACDREDYQLGHADGCPKADAPRT